MYIMERLVTYPKVTDQWVTSPHGVRSLGPRPLPHISAVVPDKVTPLSFDFLSYKT